MAARKVCKQARQAGRQTAATKENRKCFSTFWNSLSPLSARSYATTQSARAILLAVRIPASQIPLERLECSADPDGTRLEELDEERRRKLMRKSFIGHT